MAKELKTIAQLIELLESRGAATDSTTVDRLRRDIRLCRLVRRFAGLYVSIAVA